MVLIEYSSDEEYDLEEEEDIALISMLHNKTKLPKHGGSVFGRETIRGNDWKPMQSSCAAFHSHSCLSRAFVPPSLLDVYSFVQRNCGTLEGS